MRLRPFAAADAPVLDQIRARQSAATGLADSPTEWSDPRNYRIWVVEADDGAIIGALIAHATTELMLIADSPAPYLAFARNFEAIEAELNRAGADEANTFVLKTLDPKISRIMKRMGFRSVGEEFVPYYYRSRLEGPT